VDESYDAGHSAAFDGLTPVLKAEVIAKLQTQIKGQNFNAGVALAETRQTADLVASTAKRIAQSYSSLRKGNIAAAVHHVLGTNTSAATKRVGRKIGVPNQWLELQYGWKPLLSDVYGAVQALSDRLQEKPPYLSAHATRSRTQETGGTYPDSELGNGLTIAVKAKGTTRVSAGIVYSVGDVLAQAASQTGVQNPLSVAWEIVPYSFVVDWFLPVGTFLNNLDYASGLVFEYGWMSTKRTNSVSWHIGNGTRISGSTIQVFTGGSRTSSGNDFVREALNSFPDVSFPSFKNPLSLDHVANALSLLATAFGRR